METIRARSLRSRSVELTSHLTPDLRIHEVKKTSIDKPTQLDFDNFIPWLSLQLQSPVNVTVTRLIQGDYQKGGSRRDSAKSSKSVNKSKPETTSFENKPKVQVSSRDVDSVPIKAYYDVRGRLVEISIAKCLVEIPRAVIQAISLCLPFHSFLYKLTIEKGGVTCNILHEISKLLPYSNLTDICLDDTTMPKGNYDVLLAQKSQLKTLSLNRCGINDEMCKQLVVNIDFGKPSCTLLTLDLSSNQISDIGAEAFGDVLRRNRHLLHLNLSGNMITDTGALSILTHLKEFILTNDEILEKKRNKIKYTEEKTAVYQQCLKEVVSRQETGSNRHKSTGKAKLMKKTKRSPTNTTLLVDGHSSIKDLAMNMAQEIIGDFKNPFDSDHIVCKGDGCCYCVGNMFLCSLNLAYNNLDYISIRKINEVLKYQEKLEKPPSTTGLLRIVIEGNCLPKYSEVYGEIEMLLDKAACALAPKVLPKKMQLGPLKK